MRQYVEYNRSRYSREIHVKKNVELLLELVTLIKCKDEIERTYKVYKRRRETKRKM